jgi:superkiller protein 3
MALRSSNDDGSSWLRLGEAYAGAGRHTAGLKALARAEKLLPDSQVCQFQIAEVTRELGDFFASIEILNKAISTNPSDAALHAARCTTRLALARSEQAKGFLERGHASCVTTIEEALATLELEGPTARVMWKIITDASLDLGRKPIDGTADYHAGSALRNVTQRLLEYKDLLDQRIMVLIDLEQTLSECDSADLDIDLIAVKLSSASANYSVHLAGNDDNALGPACYDTSIALFELASNHAIHLNPDAVTSVRELATEYVKKAIRAQPTEPLYWSCLGSLTIDTNPKLSQHAFIRAIQCESKVRHISIF